MAIAKLREVGVNPAHDGLQCDASHELSDLLFLGILMKAGAPQATTLRHVVVLCD